MLALGAPEFRDASLAALSQSDGAAAAWQQALQGDPAPALAATGGDFAVAMRSASSRTVLAVDRFAIHTLCWRVVDGELRFATRADELADDDAGIDPQAIFD